MKASPCMMFSILYKTICESEPHLHIMQSGGSNADFFGDGADDIKYICRCKPLTEAI